MSLLDSGKNVATLAGLAALFEISLPHADSETRIAPDQREVAREQSGSPAVDTWGGGLQTPTGSSVELRKPTCRLTPRVPSPG